MKARCSGSLPRWRMLFFGLLWLFVQRPVITDELNFIVPILNSFRIIRIDVVDDEVQKCPDVRFFVPEFFDQSVFINKVLFVQFEYGRHVYCPGGVVDFQPLRT